MRLSAFHPLTALVYFAAVLAVTMFCFSPAVGICSAVGAFLFCAITQSCRQTASDLAFYIFLTAVLTVTNPLFSHKGVTPLFFVNGKAYTKEALFYGLTAGLSLIAVIMWCKALGKVLTREKLLYIFGRKTPKAALVITMTMGFIPKLKRLHRQLLDALNCSGANISDSRFDRLKKDCTVFTALCAGTLERGADTAASMKAPWLWYPETKLCTLVQVQSMGRHFCGGFCSYLCIGADIFRKGRAVRHFLSCDKA